MKNRYQGETYFNLFRGATSKRWNCYILPALDEDQLDVVLLHIGSNDVNNQTKDRINTENLTGILSILASFASILV